MLRCVEARAAGGAAGQASPRRRANEKPDVDVWQWNDTTVMSAQKISLAADRRRNLPAVWHVATNNLARSASRSMKPCRPSGARRRRW
jgi:hypothetical protein